jgi:hypothetical protein
VEDVAKNEVIDRLEFNMYYDGELQTLLLTNSLGDVETYYKIDCKLVFRLPHFWTLL